MAPVDVTSASTQELEDALNLSPQQVQGLRWWLRSAQSSLLSVRSISPGRPIEDIEYCSLDSLFHYTHVPPANWVIWYNTRRVLVPSDLRPLFMLPQTLQECKTKWSLTHNQTITLQDLIHERDAYQPSEYDGWEKLPTFPGRSGEYTYVKNGNGPSQIQSSPPPGFDLPLGWRRNFDYTAKRAYYTSLDDRSGWRKPNSDDAIDADYILKSSWLASFYLKGKKKWAMEEKRRKEE